MKEPFITSLLGLGLRVDLSQYDVRRARHGGVPLWSPQERHFIRNSAGTLGRYLADVREFKDSYVTFKYETSTGGDSPTDQAGVSRPANLSSAMRSEMKGLLEAHAAFKAQANEELRTKSPDHYDIIQNFKLPNPRLDPQFYRVYGPFYRRRLLVLWGLERKPEFAGALAPALSVEQALTTLSTGRPRLPWLLPLLMLLLIGALLLAWLGGALCTWLGIGCVLPSVKNPLGREQFVLEKSADASILRTNGSVRYSFIVRNKGDAPISDVGVRDAKIPELRCRFSLMDPVSSQTCQAQYAVSPAEIADGKVVNTAVANGKDAAGQPFETRSTHTLTLSAADIERLKTLPPRPAADGGTTTPAPGTPKDGRTPAPVPGSPKDGRTSAPVPGAPKDGGTSAPVPGAPKDGGTPAPVPGAPKDGGTPAPVPGAPKDGRTPAPVPGAPKDGGTPAPVPGAPKDGGTSAPVPGAPKDGGTSAPVPGAPKDGGTAAPLPTSKDPSLPTAAPVTLSAQVTEQTTQPNGLVDLQITGFATSATGTGQFQSADWIVEGAGRKFELSGNPIKIALPASPVPYTLTLIRADGQEITKSFMLPVNFGRIELIDRR
jgi:hypothetical protein